jgi:hypothetical protein
MIDEPASPAPGIPSEEEVRAIVWRGRLNSDTGQRTTSELFALFRPAFEAKEREIAEEHARIDRWQDRWQEERDARLSAEAKLAQAVEALEPFDDALGEDDEGYGDGLTVVMKWGACTDYSVTLGDLRDIRRARTASATGKGE